MQNKNVVYTCITGGYDAIPKHAYVHSDWDYILFTDNEELIQKGQVYHWVVRPLVYNKLSNVKNARWHKINAHVLFPSHQYSLWVDGNISIQNDAPFILFTSLINNDVKITIPLHPLRNCIYTEAETIKTSRIDYDYIVDAEVAFLQKEQYPANNGLSETNIILRKHNDPSVTNASDLWWSMIEEYSKRDQLSCNYAFWKHGVTITPLYEIAGHHRNCVDYQFNYLPSHNQNTVPFKQKYPNWLISALCLLIPFKHKRRELRKNFKSKGE